MRVPPGVGAQADRAGRRLARKLDRLDGSRDLVVALAENRPLPLIMRVLEDRLTIADRYNLERLRVALDASGRRRRRDRAADT
jgi:hypothetical protein